MAASTRAGDSLQRMGEDRRGDWALLGGLAFLLFLAHMLVSGRYGYFVDELYYLACSQHLAWAMWTRRR
jgi:hypothetical protein